MKKSFLLLFVLGQIISCGSDSLENNYDTYDRGTELKEEDPTVSEGYLLKKRFWREYGETKTLGEVAYEYDEQDRLILETSHYYYENTIPELNNVGGIVKYTYEEGVVIATYYSHENELKSTTRYIKESNNIIRTVIGYPGVTALLIRIEYLNDSGCGITKLESFDRNSQKNWSYEYEYTDANCSFIGNGYNEKGELQYVDTYTMDSKNGYHNSIAQHHHFGNITYHNDLELVSKDASGTVLSTSKSEYSYNSFDYPVTKLETNSDGRKMEFFYEYY